MELNGKEIQAKELIDQKPFKDLLCKNDDCLRKLAQIRRIEVKPGLILRIKCHSCGELSEWRFGYSQLEEQFDTIKEVVEHKQQEGGEIENG